ncbi:hypothetical protein C7964_102757 [Loktanella sp. PT4BL]|jgi:hypothetical protein|nr:hypothetical protein C7964_102757 [Loktanella sp. PT4BL]
MPPESIGVTMSRSVYEKVTFMLSQAITMFVGAVFLTIGLSGIFGVFLRPISEISFLIEPMGLGAYYDQLYWSVLTATGVWLIMFFWVKQAALFSIGLILFKWAMIKYGAPF